MDLAKKLVLQEHFAIKAIADTLKVSRSNLIESKTRSSDRTSKYTKAQDEELIPMLQEITNNKPTFGYRRAGAILNRKLRKAGKQVVNHKRVYRLMKQANMLLEKQPPKPTRTHDGKVVTLKSNLRWCSDTLEIKCWNGEKVHVGFSLDCCDREVMSWMAKAKHFRASDIRDIIAETVDARFGSVSQTPHTVQFLSDNGSIYTAKKTQLFGKKLGLEVCTTPAYSPESNGMAESFVKTFKRDYVYLNELPDAQTVLNKISEWFEDYNENHPHKGLKMMSPREFKRSHLAS